MGGEVALVEGELLFVGNFTGVRVEAGVLETEGAFGEPAGFCHALDENDFRCDAGFVVVIEVL